MITTGKIKKYSRRSGGCAINYYRKKKIQSSVCWVRSSGDYDRKKKIQSSVWRVRDLLRPEKKRYSHLSVGCAVLAITRRKKKIHYDRKKKIYSRLSDGCAVLAITTGKKRYSRLFVGCADLAITTRKKRYSCLSDGLCCCIVFCSGGKFRLQPEKKKIQSSVWWVRDHYYDRKKKIQSSIFNLY